MTRTARKHKVGKRHALAAILDAGEPEIEGDARLYIGLDDRGIEIEVVVVPDNRRANRFSIIHAMPTGFRRKQ